MEIVHTVVKKETQVPIHKRGSEHPPVPESKKGHKVTHLNLHFGIVPGQTVNFHLEPADWTICILHADLCVVGGLLQKTIMNQLDTLKDPNATESQGLQIHTLFTAVGVSFKKIKKAKRANKNLDKHDLVFKQASFTGKSGETVMQLRNKVRFVCVCTACVVVVVAGRCVWGGAT
jgi:hypothetical protein